MKTKHIILLLAFGAIYQIWAMIYYVETEGLVLAIDPILGAALIMGGTSFLGNIFGGGGGAAQGYAGRSLKMGKETLDRFDKYTDESGTRGEMAKFSKLADMFGDDASKSYLDTTEGKSFTSMIEQASKKKRNQLRQDSSMMGMTGESYLAGLGKINEQEGSSMNQLVSGSDARRTSLRSQQMQALSQVLGGEQGLFGAQQARFGQSYGIGGQIAANASNAQAASNQNASNMIGSFANAFMPFMAAGGFGGGGNAGGGTAGGALGWQQGVR